MKITGPGQTDKTQKKDKPKKTGDSSFESMVSDTGGAKSSGGTGGASGLSPAASLEALIALQGMEDSTSEEARKRAKKRAGEMLDKLEDIRMGLLSGGISRQALTELSSLISEKRGQFDDPQLKDIVEEIDLRAQVELAKYEMAAKG